jgi:hypothetical protein
LIGEEVRRRRASRDAQIYRLSLLGWTQGEIGEIFGLAQRTISDISGKFASEVSTMQNLFYEKGKSVAEIAKFYSLDDAATWAIVLQAKSDLERFRLSKRS